MKVGLPTFVRNRLDPAQRYGLRVTLIAVALVLLAVPFAYLLFEVVREGPFTSFDETTAGDLNALVADRPVLVEALEVVSWLGKPLWLGIAVGAGAVRFVSDVLGGHVLGLAWLAGSTAAFSIWRTEQGRPPVHPTEGVEPEAAEDLVHTSR